MDLAEDPSEFQLDPATLHLFQSYTGKEDEVELKEYIMDVQRRALEVHPYLCIRKFRFATLRMAAHSYYKTVLETRKASEEPLQFLDVGCCFGTDIRQLALDGYPAEDIRGIELRPEFVQLGHELFCDTPSTFPMTIIIGNILDSSQLSPEPSDTPAPLDNLKSQFSFVYVGSVLHLFDEPTIDLMISRLALLTKKGGIVFGRNGGSSKPQIRVSQTAGQNRFLHSPDSLGAVFGAHGFEGEYVAKLTTREDGGGEWLEFRATK
ncbi:hypothetical protein BC937DRAFT_95667 [Endogone sp. FLAS-F59071]|nr:hypothetical protein BC937DRAFT_95667 [Endogone sp. FLAS-F59071]|eukprot:RUS13212.1 hypothetical protein BC937DRAFT_95667 [Endogone sp. FLAS-F59071]